MINPEFKKNLENYLNFILNENINLYDYSLRNNISVYKNGKLNKGWKGLAVEHLLNLKNNNSNTSDYGFLEVKTVPIKISSDGIIKVQETTCLNVINPQELIEKSFEESSVYLKMKDTLFIFINVSDKDNPHLYSFKFFDFESNPKIKAAFKQDYETLSSHVIDNVELGNDLTQNFSGKIGEYFQPRPKIGKNRDYSWAFYMKTKSWELILEN